MEQERTVAPRGALIVLAAAVASALLWVGASWAGGGESAAGRADRADGQQALLDRGVRAAGDGVLRAGDGDCPNGRAQENPGESTV